MKRTTTRITVSTMATLLFCLFFQGALGADKNKYPFNVAGLKQGHKGYPVGVYWDSVAVVDSQNILIKIRQSGRDKVHEELVWLTLKGYHTR